MGQIGLSKYADSDQTIPSAPFGCITALLKFGAFLAIHLGVSILELKRYLEYRGTAVKFAVKAKIYGVLYIQSSSIAFDETSSYWTAPKSS